jgi:hypothetical protein
MEANHQRGNFGFVSNALIDNIHYLPRMYRAVVMQKLAAVIQSYGDHNMMIQVICCLFRGKGGFPAAYIRLYPTRIDAHADDIIFFELIRHGLLQNVE